jgi:hypothetical protein
MVATAKSKVKNGASIVNWTSKCSVNEPKVFHVSRGGFSLEIALLNFQQRLLLAEAARKKYDGMVDWSQIVDMPLESFRCNLTLYGNDGSRYVIGGVAEDTSKYPLKLSFEVPIGTKQREVFTQTLKSFMRTVCDEPNDESSQNEV